MMTNGGKSGGKKSPPTFTFLFDSRKNQDNCYTVCWRISFNGLRREYSTGAKLLEQDVNWLKQNRAGYDGRLKDDHLRNLWNMIYGETYFQDGSYVDSFTTMAKNVIIKLRNDFSFTLFRYHIENYGSDEDLEPETIDKPTENESSNDLFAFLRNKANEHDNKGETSSSELCIATINSLIRFMKDQGWVEIEEKSLKYEIVTIPFLESYEKWMLEFGSSPRVKRTEFNLRDQKKNPEKYLPGPASLATVGVYCRYIRQAMLYAKDNGFIKQEDYPFSGKGCFVIPSVSNAARALPEEDVEKLLKYRSKVESLQRAVDIWLFSYLGNGMNVKDVCFLRKDNFNRKLKTIKFFREKTQNTSKGDKIEIHVDLFSRSISIIDKWGSKDPDNPFLFPFLVPDKYQDDEGNTDYKLSPKRISSLVNQITKTTNDNLRKVSLELDLSFRLKTNDARDTQATRLAENGAHLIFIQRTLGHHDPKTTAKYIGRLPLESVKKIREGLIPKKKGGEEHIG